MTPLFFGESSAPLYGVYHPPTNGGFKSRACLICGPIGHEFTRSYAAVNLLAQALASKGSHVLRFSYSGLGDSATSSQSFSIEQTLLDIEIAMSELKDMAALKNLSLVGLRYGALLAVETARNFKVEKLVLWEPIFSGKQYLEDSKALHQKMLRDPQRFAPGHTFDSYSDDQILGHPYSAEEQKNIARLSMDAGADLKTDSIVVHASITENPDIHRDVKTRLQFGSCEISLLINDDLPGWCNLEVEEKYIPGKSISNIVSGLS